MNAELLSTSWTLPDNFKVLTPWLVRVAELWGPVESKAFIKTLSSSDLDQLAEVRKWFGQMEYRRAAEDWYDSIPIPEKESSGTQTMLRLANLLDRLGEAGVKPFADESPIEFAQRIRIKPHEVADWPDEFLYLKPLALRYGRVHSEQGLINQIAQLSAAQRRKLCTIKQRLFQDKQLSGWLDDKRNHDKKYHAILHSFAIMLDHLECPDQ